MQETQASILHRTIHAPRDHVLRALKTAYADDPETRELATRLHTHALAHRWTEAQLEDKTTIPHDLAHRVWFGYAKNGETEAFRAKAARYFESIGNPKSPAYCPNQFSRAIERVLETVQRRSRRGEQNVVAYINGASGVGKSLVSFSWCLANDQFYVSVKPMGGPQTVMRDLSRRFGVGVYASQYIVLQRLYDALGPGDVLVVNQADRLVRRHSDIQEGVDLFWDLAEQTCAGVVFLDTDGKFEARLRSTQYHARQFWRRCVRIEQLPASGTTDEIAALVKFRCPHLDVDRDWLDSAATLNEHERGGFGMVATVISDAEDWARFKGRRLPTQADLDLALAKKLESLGCRHAQ